MPIYAPLLFTLFLFLALITHGWVRDLAAVLAAFQAFRVCYQWYCLHQIVKTKRGKKNE